jgi:hypothetical protein
MRTGSWERDLDNTHGAENKKKITKERKKWSKEDHLSFSRSTVKKRTDFNRTKKEIRLGMTESEKLDGL